MWRIALAIVLNRLGKKLKIYQQVLDILVWRSLSYRRDIKWNQFPIIFASVRVALKVKPNYHSKADARMRSTVSFSLRLHFSIRPLQSFLHSSSLDQSVRLSLLKYLDNAVLWWKRSKGIKSINICSMKLMDELGSIRLEYCSKEGMTVWTPRKASVTSSNLNCQSFASNRFQR